MTDESVDTQQQSPKKSLIDQAMESIVKSNKDALMSKLKENRKKVAEAQKTIALADAEALKLIEDFNAGIL